MPTSAGTATYVLTTNGSNAATWSAVPTSISSYALTSNANDPAIGTYVELGEVTVTVASGQTVISNATFTGEQNSTNGFGIRVTRSQTAGSSTVGTIVSYGAHNSHVASVYGCATAINNETGLASGTWYYKYWVSSGNYVSGTQDYGLVITVHN